jgi:hypothetical protein
VADRSTPGTAIVVIWVSSGRERSCWREGGRGECRERDVRRSLDVRPFTNFGVQSEAPGAMTESQGRMERSDAAGTTIRAVVESLILGVLEAIVLWEDQGGNDCGCRRQ